MLRGGGCWVWVGGEGELSRTGVINLEVRGPPSDRLASSVVSPLAVLEKGQCIYERKK